MNNTATCFALKLQTNHFQFEKDMGNNEKDGINGMPGEVLYKIFSDLPLQFLASVNLVSKRWNIIENNRLITLVFFSCIEGKKVFIHLLEEFESYFDMFFPKNFENLTEFLKEPQNAVLVKMLLEVFIENHAQTKVSDILNVIKHYKEEDCKRISLFMGYLTAIKSKKNHIANENECKIRWTELNEGSKYIEEKCKEDLLGFSYYLTACIMEELNDLIPMPSAEKVMLIGLTISAKKGFKDALWKLGDFFYFKENPSDEDKSKAYRFYKRAADVKCPTAYRRIIRMARDKDITLSKEELCSYNILSAIHGDGKAKLGLCYLRGSMGFERDIEKGLYYIEEAIKSNSVEAAYWMCAFNATGLYELRNQEKAEINFNIVQNSVIGNLNDINSQFARMLGDLFEKGYGVKKNLEAAKQFYESSAVVGNEIALFALGTLYEEGDLNIDEADLIKRCYTEAAEIGSSNAQLKMCQIYSHGLYGTPINLVKAADYFKLLNQDHNMENEAEKNGNIALCYMHGFGVKKDLKLAYEFYHKASDLNHANAQYKLCLYYNQQNDLEKSQYYFNLLNDKHHPEGIYYINSRYRYISYCYANGIGTAMDKKKAAIYKQLEIDTGARFLTQTWL